MTDLPPLLRVEDLATLLGITPHGAREMIRRGEVPAARLGRRWVVRRSALLALLERREREHRTPTATEADAARVLRSLPPPRRARPSPGEAPPG